MTMNAAIVAAALLVPKVAHAQWWTAAPADYEDCAERVDKSSLAGEGRAIALSNCESRFAGRRKPGGGYLFHDFMQNRSFDLKGPNPTAAEQKLIDEQYAVYLDEQRRSIILAAFAKKQSEAQLQAAIDTDFREPVAQESAKPVTRPAGPTLTPRPRPKPHMASGPDCAKEPLACGWSKLSSGLKDIKDALFGAPQPTRSKRT